MSGARREAFELSLGKEGRLQIAMSAGHRRGACPSGQGVQDPECTVCLWSEPVEREVETVCSEDLGESREHVLFGETCCTVIWEGHNQLLWEVCPEVILKGEDGL